MIFDGILFIIKNIMNVLLLPLNLIDIAIDVVSSIPVLASFINIVAYVMPWSNIIPIFIFIVAMFSFRIVISLIKTIWQLLPFV